MNQKQYNLAADSVLKHSPIPQLIVSSEGHAPQVLSVGCKILELADGIQKPWWEQLNWCDQTIYELVKKELLNGERCCYPQVSLEKSNGIRSTYHLKVTAVDEDYLLTFSPTERPEFDPSLMEETFRGSEFRAGENYFNYCAEAFCKAFGMDCSLIARLDESGEEPIVRTVSFFTAKTGLNENISYPLLNTPCWLPYNTGEPLCIPFNIQQSFPLDEDLVTMEAESYLGVPILNEKGRAIGHLALLSSKPISEPTHTEAMFLKIFAARSGAEFQRQNSQLALRRAKRKAERANQAKTKFLANMSHEVRSPLNAVLGYAQLIAECPSLPEEQHAQARAIQRNGKHLLSLISDVLDMSRIELDHIELHEEEVHLGELNQDIRNMLLPSEGQSSNRFEIAIEDNLPPCIFADPTRIRQILTNLVSNALKYAPDALVRYQVNLLKGDSEKQTDQLQFKVSDDGPGIPPRLHETLFQPFERGLFADQAQFEGTGLGLPIARRLARTMGGDVTLESKVSEGSTFIFTIPVKVCPNSKGAAAKKTTSEKSQKLSGKVLVVDDNEANREIVNRLLTRTGLTVIEAIDGQDGLETCLAKRPDLVLMDVRMPKMSGLEASSQIRKTLQADSPPIIGLTGDLLDVKGAPRKHEVFDLVVGKPFDFKTLIEVVTDTLAQQR